MNCDLQRYYHNRNSFTLIKALKEILKSDVDEARDIAFQALQHQQLDDGYDKLLQFCLDTLFVAQKEQLLRRLIDARPADDTILAKLIQLNGNAMSTNGDLQTLESAYRARVQAALELKDAALAQKWFDQLHLIKEFQSEQQHPPAQYTNLMGAETRVQVAGPQGGAFEDFCLFLVEKYGFVPRACLNSRIDTVRQAVSSAGIALTAGLLQLYSRIDEGVKRNFKSVKAQHTPSYLQAGICGLLEQLESLEPLVSENDRNYNSIKEAICNLKVILGLQLSAIRPKDQFYIDLRSTKLLELFGITGDIELLQQILDTPMDDATRIMFSRYLLTVLKHDQPCFTYFRDFRFALDGECMRQLRGFPRKKMRQQICYGWYYKEKQAMIELARNGLRQLARERAGKLLAMEGLGDAFPKVAADLKQFYGQL